MASEAQNRLLNYRRTEKVDSCSRETTANDAIRNNGISDGFAKTGSRSNYSAHSVLLSRAIRPTFKNKNQNNLFVSLPSINLPAEYDLTPAVRFL